MALPAQGVPSEATQQPAPVNPASSPTQTPDPQVTPAETVQEKSGGGRNFKIIFMIFLAIALLALVGIGGYYYLFISKSAQPEPIVTYEPSPIPTEEDVVVENEADLEAVDQKLGQEDTQLETDLEKLEKDSDF